tara:strand:- start:320 stop:2116 length:1797 start_codon:yes stop_codon:yes gene_type:complete
MHSFIHFIIILLASMQILQANPEHKIEALSCIPGLQSDSFDELENSLLCLHNLQLKGEGAAGYSIYQYFFNGAPEKEQNPELALSYLIAAARLNHPRSLDRLAWHFETGKFLERNLAAAYSLYLKAAELGFTKSLVNLGRWLISGEGHSQDAEAAFQLFYQASLQGSPEAQFELAHMYKRGLPVEQNFTKYKTHLLRAASGGHVGAILEISRNHLEGRHEEKNINKALHWMKTLEGNPRIDMMRAMLLLSQSEVEFNHQGIELLHSLSLLGHAPASNFLSELHEDGHFFSQKSKTAKHIYSRTAQRQAGYLPPISKNYAKDYPSLRDVPQFLEKYDARKSETLWPETVSLAPGEHQKSSDDLAITSDSPLKKWLNEYEKKQKELKKLKSIKTESKPNKTIKNIGEKTQESLPKKSPENKNQILSQSRLIEKTLDEIKIVDPIANLKESLMLIKNRILLANGYLSLGHLELMRTQLNKSLTDSLKILSLLSKYINKKLAYPKILDAINDSKTLDAARNLWTQSFANLRFGSIELIQSVENIINLYSQSGNESKAEDIKQKLHKLIYGQNNYGFLCVTFNQEHPLNKISKSLSNRPFDIL